MMLQKEKGRGRRVEMGIHTVVQGGRPGWRRGGVGRKEGARAAEGGPGRSQSLRGAHPGRAGPLISAIHHP